MRILWMTIAAVLCVSCSAKKNTQMITKQRAVPPSVSSAKPLTVSEISENPSGKYPRYKALMDDLSEHVKLKGYGGTAVKIYPDSQQLIRALGEGETQLVLEGAYSVLCAASRLNGETLLINAKGSDFLFQTFFIVPDSSPLRSLEDLRGAVLALEDNESTSGYFAPLVALRKKTMPYDNSEPFSNDAVGVYLAGEDELILRDLFAGTADCGVLPDYEWDELEPEVRGRLRIIYQSEFMPRSLLLISPELNSSDRKSLASYFIAMNGRSEADSVLEELNSGGFYYVDDVYEYAALDELTGLCDELHW